MLSYDLSVIIIHISHYCQFSDICISQGSVATYVRCGGMFKYAFVANLPVSLSEKKFWKSVNIWGSYGQEFSVLFFWLTVYISSVASVHLHPGLSTLLPETLSLTMHLYSSHVFSSLSFHTPNLGSNFLCQLFVASNHMSITNSLWFGTHSSLEITLTLRTLALSSCPTII